MHQNHITHQIRGGRRVSQILQPPSLIPVHHRPRLPVPATVTAPPAPTIVTPLHQSQPQQQQQQQTHGNNSMLPQQIARYPPPHQRDILRLNHYVQQRNNSHQMHQILQTKNRSHCNNSANTAISTISSNNTHQQQITPTHNIVQNQQILQNPILLPRTIIMQQQQQQKRQHQQQQQQVVIHNHHPHNHQFYQQHYHYQQQSSAISSSSISSSSTTSSSPSSLTKPIPSSSHRQQQITQNQSQKRTKHCTNALQPENNTSSNSHDVNDQNSSDFQESQKRQQQKNSKPSQSSELSSKSSNQEPIKYKILKPQQQNNQQLSSINNNSQQSIVQSKSNQILPTQNYLLKTINRLSANKENVKIEKGNIQKNVDSNISSEENPLSSQQKIKQKQKKTEKNPKLAYGNIEQSKFLNNNETLANTKEKTPMCLVNELARYNKIQHQYRLTGEQGPAHLKRFTVTLKLGIEEYTSEGTSIKKAQHSAAAEAICKTKYTHPPIKSARLKFGQSGNGHIMPTVELNALAMKLGTPAVYVYEAYSNLPENILQAPLLSGNLTSTSVNLNRSNQCQSLNQNNFNYNMLCDRPTKHFFAKHIHLRVKLKVGTQEFIGIGKTLQEAKHNAAARALKILKPLVVPEESSNNVNVNTINIDQPNTEIKSPISLVHEIALKKNLTVLFDVQCEKGPPHMKTFVTICKVGNLITEGEGNGKKKSKKRAAENMLEELKKLAPLSPSCETNNNYKHINKKSVSPKHSQNIGNSINKVHPQTRKLKNNKELESNIDINPISKLIHIQQASKGILPIYKFIEEKGPPRCREFVMEVSVGNDCVARGSGSSKKMAKKLAAKNLLILMGYDDNSPNKENSSKAANGIDINKNIDNENLMRQTNAKIQQQQQQQQPLNNSGGSIGRQIVPGLILVNSRITDTTDNSQSSTSGNNQRKSSEQQTELKIENTTSSTTKPKISLDSIEKNNNNSFNNNNILKQDQQNDLSENENSLQISNSNSNYDDIRPKDQLLYLADLLKFKVAFSDYPKGNHGEFLTVVILNTDPPQICHGAGADINESQDKASKTALNMLSYLGLDNVKPKKVTDELMNDHKKPSAIN